MLFIFIFIEKLGSHLDGTKGGTALIRDWSLCFEPELNTHPSAWPLYPTFLFKNRAQSISLPRFFQVWNCDPYQIVFWVGQAGFNEPLTSASVLWLLCLPRDSHCLCCPCHAAEGSNPVSQGGLPFSPLTENPHLCSKDLSAEQSKQQGGSLRHAPL